MPEFHEHDHQHEQDHHRCRGRWRHRGHHGGSLYFLGAVGAAVYYVQSSVGFLGAVLGVLKGLVWPALLVYHVFETLKY